VVVDAYDQLVAEGYLVSRHGSGTQVADGAWAGRTDTPADRSSRTEARWDLRPGTPDLSLFPRTAWLAAVRSTLAELPDRDLGYPDVSGVGPLRELTAAYLGRVRAVDATADDVVITSGFFHGLVLLAKVLRLHGVDRVAVEDPGQYQMRELLAGEGLTAVPVPIDDQGLIVDALGASGVRAAVLTPTHQFPMGVALSPERRTALVAWARDVDGWIVEDDYDSEFRYDREPVGAIQGLDPERVIHAGSVSKSLAPALRLGSLVVPEPLLSTLLDHLTVVSGRPPAIEQFAFARFVASGAHDRHLRKARSTYRAKRDLVIGRLGPVASLHGIAAGLHVVVVLPDGADEQAVVDELARRGVAVGALAPHAVEAAVPPGMVVSYGAQPAAALGQALDVVAEVLAGV
jgi:GntR family transcriptional regulator/MocR family aminotransferase